MASHVEEVEHLLVGMSRAEKAAVLQVVVRDLGDAFPGIESAPDVCGGDPRIVRTRIPVWALVSLREQGVSDAEILAAYPTLRVEDVANAWAYDRVHHEAVLGQIREQEAA